MRGVIYSRRAEKTLLSAMMHDLSVAIVQERGKDHNIIQT
jgi:hypothetical protein